MLKQLSYCLIIGSILISCTSHPVISPEPLKADESYRGVVFSAENVFPQFVYRKGLGGRTDIGVRVGMLPILGSGVDMTFTLRDEGTRLHTINLAGTYAEQSSFEATYYNISRKKRSKRIRKNGKTYIRTDKKTFNYGYLGLRYAYYLDGLWGDKKHLFGALYGRSFKKNWGAEIGYFHDFSGVPPVPEFGLDSKYAPLAGISFRVWFGKLITR